VNLKHEENEGYYVTNWTVSTATSSQYLAVNCEPIV
jgi:hypothetical protein